MGRLYIRLVFMSTDVIDKCTTFPTAGQSFWTQSYRLQMGQSKLGPAKGG